MIEDDMVNDQLLQDVVQFVADHGRITVGAVVQKLMVDMEVPLDKAKEIVECLIADGKVHYQPAYLEVRE